ncbi:unnamed protein product, partial [Sphagnum troendelagicum]
ILMRLNKEEEDEGGSEVQTPDNKKFPENPNESSNSPEQALETTLENLSHTRNGNKLEQEIDGANCKHDSEIGDLNPDNELKQFANLYVDDELAPNSGSALKSILAHACENLNHDFNSILHRSKLRVIEDKKALKHMKMEIDLLSKHGELRNQAISEGQLAL